MSDDELSYMQARNLLESGRGIERHPDWWVPHRRTIREAVGAGESFVELEGRRFKISTTGLRILVAPVEGYAPRGWFDDEWLKEVDI